MGSLESFLKTEKYKNYDPPNHKGTDKFWFFADDLLKGLQRIHEYQYLHLDLKPGNKKRKKKRKENKKEKRKKKT